MAEVVPGMQRRSVRYANLTSGTLSWFSYIPLVRPPSLLVRKSPKGSSRFPTRHPSVDANPSFSCRPQRRRARRDFMKQITERIIGAAIEVHRALGPGLLESVYEDCLSHEMT